jgi:hypothetical protein
MYFLSVPLLLRKKKYLAVDSFHNSDRDEMRRNCMEKRFVDCNLEELHFC